MQILHGLMPARGPTAAGPERPRLPLPPHTSPGRGSAEALRRVEKAAVIRARNTRRWIAEAIFPVTPTRLRSPLLRGAARRGAARRELQLADFVID
ncbi:MAG: hypothetical protein KGO01_22770, partial [Burkholderiales bacterium]|nr:hypothetical protein [Burkholderiales bacterium]